MCKDINRLAIRGAAICTVLSLGGVAVLPRPALAAPTIQTFGPGKVSCQPLAGLQMDCLLSADRISDNRSVASFGSACSRALSGRRVSAESTRLSAVTSVHWIRPSAATAAR